MAMVSAMTDYFIKIHSIYTVCKKLRSAFGISITSVTIYRYYTVTTRCQISTWDIGITVITRFAEFPHDVSSCLKGIAQL